MGRDVIQESKNKLDGLVLRLMHLDNGRFEVIDEYQFHSTKKVMLAFSVDGSLFAYAFILNE